MSGCMPADTPMVPNVKLWEKGSALVNTGRYQMLVDKLIYLSHTRPDITFSVSVVSQSMHASYEKHLEAVYIISRYLNTNLAKDLFYKKSSKGIFLSVQMQTGSGQSQTESQCLGIVPIWGEL
ncbi:hypothetical protein L195_g000452 [Trifolium pratense]|uniref:Mitochondrial protein n=1 Tax=Trifolium pratense TaxID=57577 RepID=A0A2K3NLZ0_TRIPR|nr:hypothetical protein L195_g000452 [Trifolium pratense]